MSPSTLTLDDEELLHLALHAGRGHRHDAAIDYLKRAVQEFPRSAKAHYLLGAEHAQIGLYERAAAEMKQAIQLDPTLSVAQFQLGLLQLTTGHAQEAEIAWQPLDRLARHDPLYLFKSGLLHLIRDELPACIQALEQGIANNSANEPLNDDMRRVLNDLQERTAAAQGTHGEPAPFSRTSHALLSAYRQNRDEPTVE
jgi:tetratricopeptide (TPR) repeat protein